MRHDGFVHDAWCVRSCAALPAAARTFDSAFAVFAGDDPDLCAYPVFQCADMRDDADQFAVLLQACQGVQCGFECRFIERSEAFVEKQGIDTDVAAGHAGQSQCQRQADDEAFAAGKVPCRADFSGLIVVDDVQFQRLVIVADEQVPVGHFLQLPVRVGDHEFECQSLCEVAVFFAV